MAASPTQGRGGIARGKKRMRIVDNLLAWFVFFDSRSRHAQKKYSGHVKDFGLDFVFLFKLLCPKFPL